MRSESFPLARTAFDPMRQRLRQLVHRTARSLAVGVALLGFLAAQVGFPLTPRPAAANPSHASAGRVRPCGCSVADDSRSCCCCCSAKPVDPGPCCHDTAAEPEDPPEAPPEEAVVWVIGSLVQQCHGVQTVWISLGAVLPLELESVSANLPLVGDVPCADVFAVPRSTPPLDPPPRSSAV